MMDLMEMADHIEHGNVSFLLMNKSCHYFDGIKLQEKPTVLFNGKHLQAIV